MFGWMRSLWQFLKDMFAVSKQGYSLIGKVKSTLKFTAAVVLLVEFIAGFPLLLCLYYFKWSRNVLYLILRFVGMYDTAVKLEYYIAKIWGYVQIVGSLLTSSYRSVKYPFGFENGSTGIYLQLGPEYPDVLNCQLFDQMVKDCESGNLVLDKTVLEMDCDSRGGINYIGCNYKPRQCIATTGSTAVHQQLKQKNLRGVEYVLCPTTSYQDSPVLKNSTFDVIFCVNIFNGKIDQQRIKQIIGLLSERGVVKVADMMEKHRVNHFECLIERAGLKIVGSRDITPNIVRSILMQKERHNLKQQLIELLDGQKSRLMEQLSTTHSFHIYTLTKQTP